MTAILGNMDPAVRTVLALLMRWTHVISVITLLGGFVYARLVLAPAVAALPGDASAHMPRLREDRGEFLLEMPDATTRGSWRDVLRVLGDG